MSFNPEKESALDYSQIAGVSMAQNAKQAALAQVQVQANDVQTLTDMIMNRLSGMMDTATDTNSRLATLRDRTFGSPPEADGANGPQAVPNGRRDEIDLMLDALASRLYRGNSLAAELMSRI